jgi:nitroreductase
MNPVIQAIKNRRSVRSYQAKPVPNDIIEMLVDAGNWAPTGCNYQPWRFVVVTDPAVRLKLLAAARPSYRRSVEGFLHATGHLREHITEMLPRCLGWPPEAYESLVNSLLEAEDVVYYSAPVVIFVIGSPPLTVDADCAMVCQNIMLAAHSLGLGSCWVGFGSRIRHDPGIVATLELTEEETIFGPIVVGYPDILPNPPEKKEVTVKWI